MTTRFDHRGHNWAGRLWRDEGEGIILGVCAGAARAFGINVTVLRVITLAWLLISTPCTLAGYFGAAVFMADRPGRGNPRP